MNNMNIILFMFMSFLISSFMSIMSWILMLKKPSKEKVSTYECGFNPFNNPGEPYSMSFFLMAMLFMVFDLEIVLLFPWSLSSNNIMMDLQGVVYLFITILLIGLIYEWYKGGLEWE